MSLELHVFMNANKLPTRQQWQSAITEMGFPLQLDPELDLTDQSGFSPCTLNGKSTGCEISLDSPDDILPAYPSMRERAQGTDRVVTFCWGGDSAECACALAAAAALVKRSDGIAYNPQDDEPNDFDQLRNEFRKCIADLEGRG